MSALVGRLLGRNYRVVEPIGAGAMGMVFVVEHVHLPKRFAAKILTPDLARHPEAVARFEVEAHAVSQLEHENIVSIVDYGKTDDGCVFIIMELLRGKTLQARIDQGPVSLEEIVATMIQVCRALAAAHAAGIVHRDMKPENVFLAHRQGDGRPLVKILDFGVSKARESTLRDGRITRQGQVLGSPEYMSPEASRGEEVDARADIYSVGIMLYQLLCGDVPFRHENYLKVLQMHVTQPPVRPRALAPDLPEALERVVLRALEKDPALRPASIEEFELELVGALPDVAERAMSASQIPPRAPWARSQTLPPVIVGDADPTAAPASADPPPPAAPASADPRPPGQRNDGTTLDTRRRRGRAGVLVFWCSAVAAVAAAATAFWVTRRDHGASSQPAPGADGQGAAVADQPAGQPAAIDEQTRPSVRPGEVRLRIDSSPRGATVTLEGRRLGRTPIDAHVSPGDGDGEIELELRGYRTVRRSIVLDRNAQLHVSLRREVRRKPPSGRPDSSRRSRDTGGDPDPPAGEIDIKERR